MEKYDIIVVLIAVLGLVGTFYSMFFKPMHDLKIAITGLTTTIEHNQAEIDSLKCRVSEHGKELDNHQSILDRNNLK